MASILENPSIFNFIQGVLRVSQVREYFVTQYVRPKQGDRILDIGCGTGELRPYFAGCRYFGFDVDEKYLKRAQAQFGNQAEFAHADISRIDLPENSFDIAIAAGVLHHLNDVQARALFRLAMRSLKPGGRLCSFDMCNRDGGFFQSLMNRIDRGEYIRRPEAYVALARETFSELQVFDYCGRLLFPATHCVMVCTKSLDT